MKIFKLSIALALVGTMTCFMSCKDDADDAKEAIQEKIIGLMSANVDGAEWKADAPYGSINGDLTLVTGVGLLGENKQAVILSIKGTETGNYPINYNPFDTVSNSLNAGTYNMNYDEITAANTYSAFDGQIDVTEITDTRMTGTFSFKCANFGAGTGNVDTLEITDGSFSNIRYKD